MTMADGTTFPADDELDWVSHEIAVRLAGKAWETRQSVTNSPVRTIQIIDASYKVVQEHGFDN